MRTCSAPLFIQHMCAPVAHTVRMNNYEFSLRSHSTSSNGFANIARNSKAFDIFSTWAIPATVIARSHNFCTTRQPKHRVAGCDCCCGRWRRHFLQRLPELTAVLFLHGGCVRIFVRIDSTTAATASAEVRTSVNVATKQ